MDAINQTDSEKNSVADKSKSDFLIQPPSIVLPKGGGAIKSIDEKFSVNAANGTSGFSIPFPFSQSRNDFIPSVSLSYNSGNGNGIFGLGWNADVPSITRKTEKELPQYYDCDESDTFIFSGVEDLVPKYDFNNTTNNWERDKDQSKGVVRYRPRIEGGFAKIERIKKNDDHYWKVTSKDNITSIFGKNKSAQIFDSSNPSKIFKWLLEFSYDDKGNCYRFEYKQENNINIPNVLHEKNRIIGLPVNTYLKRIKYCNKDHLNKDDIDFTDWENYPDKIEFLLELVLDYGEHDANDPRPDDNNNWICRRDPFSDYRSGFEIRTYRLCNRILMFHLFEELGSPYLVRSTEFAYTTSTSFTFLTAINQKGFIRKAGIYSIKALPPLEFTYEKLGWNTDIQIISEENMIGAPIGLNEKNYQWIDLYGEGVSGILTEQNTGWYYKDNKGDGNFTNGSLVVPKPSFSGLNSGSLQFQDIEANGKKFLVSQNDNGYFEFTESNEWLPFRNFERTPNIDFNDPNLKFLDLNGDGRADILISEDDVFTWYASKGKEGFDDSTYVRKNIDEEQGPNIVFADITQSVVLADMSGDGLTDIVRIRNGEIVYWPNLGYGKFGAKVSMSNAPLFDCLDAFNARFVKLADIDGSGTTDIVYLGNDSFKIYFNQSGNSWSETNTVNGVNPLPFPKIDNLINVSIIDLLGSGTSCIVWSSPLPSHARFPLLYIDLMDGKKPYIMTSYKNNIGKEVYLQYTSSTKFYLKDKKEGKNWVTKLPFPVQCVSKVEIKDRISKTSYTNCYKYHHGYYDYYEREFRGFGMVEQIDTDTFSRESLDQHPVLTKTWYHTGAFLNREKIFSQFEKEYFYNNPEIRLQLNSIAFSEKKLNEPSLIDNLTVDECREAFRACKGIPLRIEIFFLDNSVEQEFPYSSAQHTCEIKFLQPILKNKHAVFLVHEAEALTYYYERNPADPRIAHTLITAIDDYGNVNETASIAYGRKDGADLTGIDNSDYKIQQQIHIMYALNNFTNLINTDKDYRLKVLYETETYELTSKAPTDMFYTIDELKIGFATALEINYEEAPTDNILQKRKVEHTRYLFWDNNLSAPLSLGSIDSLALPYESYQLAFTKSLVDARFNNVSIKVDDNLLLSIGKYVKLNDTAGGSLNSNNYWIPSGIRRFDGLNFYQVIEVYDPFGTPPSIIEYDTKYHLYIQQVIDSVGNISQIDSTTIIGINQPCFNFRTISPYVLKDKNNNRAGIRTDELGMVQTTFVMGKENETMGDVIDLTSIEISPNDKPTTILEYAINSWLNQSNAFPIGFDPDIDYYKPQPNFVKLQVREKHEAETSNPVWQVSYSYSDGSGHEIMKKIQAEPGNAPQRDTNENLLHDSSGNLIFIETNPRWVGTGRTILNNKGKPVMQYEPFFSSIFHFEDEKEMVQSGVTPVFHYDPLGRAIKTDFPDGTYSEVLFDAWQQITYDQNDTVEKSKWYDERILHPISTVATSAEISSAQKTLLHKDTPTIVHFDSLGRAFLSIADNGGTEKYRTASDLDLEGNLLQVTDALQNPVMQYQYDMLGNKVCQLSMDTGERWMLNDVAGKPIRSWNSRDNDNYMFQFYYDELHRPSKMSFIKNNDTEIIYEKIIYAGTSVAEKNLNLCGNPIEHYDTAGVIKNIGFDFKGNLLNSSRRLLKNYKDNINWESATAPELENEIFASSITYDALNRPVTIFTPSSLPANANEIVPRYNEANLLNSLSIKIRGADGTPFINDINYDAKGQRESITYSNNVKTTYKYDPFTFRLTQLLTIAQNSAVYLQQLNYTYDPVGNITQIEDTAQQNIFYNNAKASPVNSYTYDAVYRLIQANGREHIGQNQQQFDNWNDADFINLVHKGDGNAMRSYIQKYTYDAVGNIHILNHNANGGTYTRTYAYNCNDADRAAFGVDINTTKNNQLLATIINGTTFTYGHDDHGNMNKMPHLSIMQWDFKDQLYATRQTADENGETTYYIYDAGGQRIRKITEVQGGTAKKEERIYLNCFEIYRNYKSDGTTIELERETLHIMDDKRRFALVETKTIDNDSNDNTQTSIPLTRYQHDNHLGSAYLELNENAEIISYEEYYPYGTTSYQAIDKNINPVAKRYRYVNKERDEETGFNYHDARYYIPWLGRWGKADPIGIRDGMNLYLYTHGNPITFSDPNGRLTIQNKTSPNPPSKAEFDTYTDALRADIKTLFGAETDVQVGSDDNGGPTAEVTLKDQNNDGNVDQKDVDVITKKLKSKFKATLHNKAHANSKDLDDAMKLVEMFLKKLLPKKYNTDHSTSNLKVFLDNGETDMGSANVKIENHNLAAAMEQNYDGNKDREVVINPQQAVFERKYEPDDPAKNKFNLDQASKAFGPLMVLMHELIHNTLGKSDAKVADPAHPPSFEEDQKNPIKGDTILALNPLERALGMPTRLSHNAYHQSYNVGYEEWRGRKILFEGGIIILKGVFPETIKTQN